MIQPLQSLKDLVLGKFEVYKLKSKPDEVIVEAPGVHFTMASEWTAVRLSQFLDLHSKQKFASDEDTVGYYTERDCLESLVSDVASLHRLEARHESKLLNILKFLHNRPDFRQLSVPARTLGVTPPTELGTCSLFQKWCTEQLIEDRTDEGEKVDFITLAVPLLSIYLYPILTGKTLTDMDQLGEVTSQIDAMPVLEALPLSAFFLTNWRSLTTTGETSLKIKYRKRPRRRWLTSTFRRFTSPTSPNSASSARSAKSEA